MRKIEDVRADIAVLEERAAAERDRAARAADVAVHYEQRALSGPASLREFRIRMAELHRLNEQRHLASARLQAMHARRLRAWAAACDDVAYPSFVTAVAEELHVASVGLTLTGGRQPEASAAFTDRVARASRDVELVVDEGPIDDAMATESSVVATGPEIMDNWPRYGPAIAEFGVRAVAALPLRASASCLGAICIYASEPAMPAELVTRADELAGVITHTVLAVPGRTSVDPLGLFDDTATRAVVHQAAGMVSVHNKCGVGDAIAMLRARAFTEGTSVDDVATRVVTDGLPLF